MTTPTPRGTSRKTRAGSPPQKRRPRRPDPSDDALIENATRNTLAANPLVGVRRQDVVAAAATFMGQLARKPAVVASQYAKLLADSARIASGRSALTPTAGDRRFADAAWAENPMFKRVLQSYLALGQSLDRCVDGAGLDAVGTARAHFAVDLLVDALAPTNFVATNPVALRKLVNSKGASVVRGFANLIEDVANGTGLPRQVDTRPFTVGRNVAATSGAVVYRNELLELIQYAPMTSQIHARPLLIVPPQINKYYVFDLAPDKSLVRFALESGIHTFAVSWRNPARKHAGWGFDAYTEALEQALDAMCAITGSADVNVLGACSGGMTLAAMLGHLAARRVRIVHSATLAVCVLDMEALQDATMGLFATPAAIGAAKSASRKRGVMEGAELARMFAWMRPNDLVWNYVVNNYLLGNEPPAHDILFWNNDTTRLPAQLHADFLDLVESNAFARRNALRVRGTSIDLRNVGIDTYVVGGLTDHITTWQGVYRTARLLGASRSTFVLSNAGHIQSLINPPGKGRSWFMAGAARAHTPDAWTKRQKKNEGSWWPHWANWLRARSGPLQTATGALGSENHPPLAPAPGTYVLER